jgi:hypothetical protein
VNEILDYHSHLRAERGLFFVTANRSVDSTSQPISVLSPLLSRVERLPNVVSMGDIFEHPSRVSVEEGMLLATSLLNFTVAPSDPQAHQSTTPIAEAKAKNSPNKISQEEYEQLFESLIKDPETFTSHTSEELQITVRRSCKLGAN